MADRQSQSEEEEARLASTSSPDHNSQNTTTITDSSANLHTSEEANADAPNHSLTSDANDPSVEDALPLSAANASSPSLQRQTSSRPTMHTSGNISSAGHSASQPAAYPDEETRRGVHGFGALVEAFMNGFRQSMMAASGRSNSQSTMPASDQPTDRTGPEQIQRPSNDDVDRANQTTEGQTSEPVAEMSEAAAAAVGGQGSSSSSSDADGSQNLFFRVPFLGRDGEGAILEFRPGPIPVPPPDIGAPVPQYDADRPADLGPERGNGLASGYHLPTAPIFVPLGASPLPFSFIFDTHVNTAWPLAAIEMPAETLNSRNPAPQLPQFMAGPPFHIALNIFFGRPPETERADPERAARFVSSLERADAELRMRMARLGMGDIGDYGGSQDNEGGEDAAIGCGVCLDPYPDEDRPEWIGGQASIDEEVVAVPCAGHHTLHHRCLYEWLSNTPPSQWTCPFCRAPLDKQKVDDSAADGAARQASGPPPTASIADTSAKKSEHESAKSRSLREEVRMRERLHGWRCDSPACLPRYPPRNAKQDGRQGCLDDDECDHAVQEQALTLIALLPCRHKLHFDCLCTSMKLEQAESASVSSEEEEEGEEEADEDGTEHAPKMSVKASSKDAIPSQDPPTHLPSTLKETVGKWVTCPLCRHESWAEMPVRRRPRRAENSLAPSGVPHTRALSVD